MKKVSIIPCFTLIYPSKKMPCSVAKCEIIAWHVQCVPIVCPSYPGFSMDFCWWNMAVCQNLVPLVNIKIAGKWMFIPLKMVSIGIDPYPYGKVPCPSGSQEKFPPHRPRLPNGPAILRGRRRFVKVLLGQLSLEPRMEVSILTGYPKSFKTQPI